MGEANANQGSNYFHEIDGLRAIAVIAVVINHLNKDVLPGGFLGVDIFFVISGFVIALSLVKSWKRQRFSDFILGFYARRAKRILPALVFYLLVFSLLISFFNQDPQTSLRIGSHALFGVSNISLHGLRSDYFAPTEALNPFLQTWSLGVEEQFYILFPFVFYFVFAHISRSSRLLVLAVATGAISVGSFILFLHFFGSSSSSFHYLPGFRFWEIGVGVIAYWVSHSQTLRKYTSHKNLTVFEASCFLIVVICLCLSESWTSVTILAIVVAMGVFLALRASGKGSTRTSLITALLSTLLLRKVGNISYSLYLWHWGIICIANWTIGITPYTSAMLIVVMLAASYASYRYIEVPFRNSRFSSSKTLAAGLLSILLSFLFVKVVSAKSKYLYLGERAKSTFLAGCSGDKNSDYWIYGDSHTHEMQKAIAAAASPSNCYRADQDDYPEDLVLGVKSRRRSTGSITSARFHILSNLRGFGQDLHRYKPAYVVINKYWLGSFGKPEEGLDSYDAKNISFYDPKVNKAVSHEEALLKYVNSLASLIKHNSNTRFIIVAPEPEFDWVGEGGPKNVASGICDPQWFNLGYGTPLLSDVCKQWNTPAYTTRKSFILRRERFLKVLSYLANSHPNVILFDTVPHLCDKQRCSTHSKDGTRLYQDDDHLAEGSIGYLTAPLKKELQTGEK